MEVGSHPLHKTQRMGHPENQEPAKAIQSLGKRPLQNTSHRNSPPPPVFLLILNDFSFIAEEMGWCTAGETGV